MLKKILLGFVALIVVAIALAWFTVLVQGQTATRKGFVAGPVEHSRPGLRALRRHLSPRDET